MTRPSSSKGYDETDIESILRYAAKLTGKTLKGVLELDRGTIVGGTDAKGKYGQAIEEEYFHIKNNNLAKPDFKDVGMELKATPIIKGRNGYRSKERLVLGIMDYNDVPVKGFRLFLDKNRHLLIIFYLWNKDMNIYEYKILKVVDWKPNTEEMRIIREDWSIIEGYILRGEAHLLSERHTRFLSACTKGVGHGEDLREQPYSDTLAKQRALSFKATFMTSIFGTHEDINELLIDHVPKTSSMSQSIFKGDWQEGMTFEEYVLDHYRRFVNMTCIEIEKELDIDLNGDSKQYYYTLALAMAGVIGKKHIKEFEEAGIRLKTMRIKLNGVPKESMSFPAFDYGEIINQEWIRSDLYDQLDKRFFMPVFGFNTNEPKEETRKSLCFKGAFFWYMPDKDFDIVEKVWTETCDRIRADDFDHFVRIKDHRIVHVRPHAMDSKDTCMYKDIERKKVSFWINGQYLADIVGHNLKEQMNFDGYN